jgi:hypothetical protein
MCESIFYFTDFVCFVKMMQNEFRFLPYNS